MSRSFTGSAGGSYLQADGTFVLTYPFSVVLWIKPGALVASKNWCEWWFGDKDSDATYLSIGTVNGKARITARGGGVFKEVDTTNSVSPDGTHCLIGVFEDADDRRIVLDGDEAGAGISLDSVTVAGFDRMALGAYRDSTPTGGYQGEMAYPAIYTRGLTAGERAQLAAGKHPRDLPDLYDVWPLVGTGDTESGSLAVGPVFTAVGAPQGSWIPPVNEPTGSGGETGAGVAEITWSSGLLTKTNGSSALSSITLAPSVTVPSGSGTHKLFALVELMLASSAAATPTITLGAMTLTHVADNGWAGGVGAPYLGLYSITNPSAGSASLVAADTRTIWSGHAVLLVVEGAADPTAFEFGATDVSGASTITDTITTSVGSIVIAAAAMQGYDGAPASISWPGSTVQGRGAGGSSLTTAATFVAATKPVTSGTSETPSVSFSTNDGRSYLFASIPPAVAPAAPAEDIKASITVSDTAYVADGSGDGEVAKLHVAVIELDRTAKEIRLRVDGVVIATEPWTGTEDAGAGDIVIGAELLDGVIQTANKLNLSALYLNTVAQTDAGIAAVEARLARELAPVVTSPYVTTGTAFGFTTIDLAPVVRDPGGWGWEIIGVDALTAGISASVASAKTLLLDASEAGGDVAVLRARLKSLHPLEPVESIQVQVTLVVWTVPDRNATVPAGATTLIDVIQGQEGPSGQAVTLEAVSDPDHGTAVVSGGQVAYTPTSGYTGPDAATYTARASGGSSATGNLAITVTGADPVDMGDTFLGLPKLWEFNPTTAAIGIKGIGAAAGNPLSDYLRSAWAGRGSTGFLDSHYSLSSRHLSIVNQQGRNCLRYDFWQYAEAAAKFDYAPGSSYERQPITFRSSAIGAPFSPSDAMNSGLLEAVFEYEIWIPADFNTRGAGETNAAPLKCHGVWIGPWGGATVDDISPPSGELTIREQMNKGGCYSAGTCATTSPTEFENTGSRMGCSLRFQITGDFSSGQGRIKPYLYIIGRLAADGTWGINDAASAAGWSPAISPVLKLGQWVKIRAYIKLNTLGKRDGILRLWANNSETPYCDLSDVNYRGSMDWRIQGPWFNNSWGGNIEKTYARCQQTNFLLYSNFRLFGA